MKDNDLCKKHEIKDRQCLYVHILSTLKPFTRVLKIIINLYYQLEINLLSFSTLSINVDCCFRKDYTMHHFKKLWIEANAELRNPNRGGSDLSFTITSGVYQTAYAIQQKLPSLKLHDLYDEMAVIAISNITTAVKDYLILE